MVRLLRLALLFILCTGSTLLVAQTQDVEVSVDRTSLSRGETLILTIRVFQQRQNIQLDLSPITDDFDILSTRTSSQIRSINNQVESWVDYIITLFPVREGELQIPALDVSGQLTAPINISVVDAGPNSNQPNNELYLETEVNKQSVYVQEQLLFTIRLYYTISGIRNPQFTELEMADTVIQLIGSPNQFEKLIDGVRYGVYEKRFVIFPQSSGTLEIPDILFRGEVTDGSSNFVFRNLNTQRVTAYIEGTNIEVKERPVAAQASSFWLPANGITLEETWTGDLDALRVGDSVLRTLVMRADGLDGAALPPFSPAVIDGANLYPDPAEVQRTFVEGKIVGTRTEATSIVATAAGSIVIPEISVPWWDINSDELRHALLPARELRIATVDGLLPAEQSIAAAEIIAEAETAAPILDQSMLDRQNEARLLNVPRLWISSTISIATFVLLIAIYFTVANRFDFHLLRYLRNSIQVQRQKFHPSNNERVAFAKLGKAIDHRDLKLLREALIVWSVHYFAPEIILSMDDVIRKISGSGLEAICLQIQAGLYNARAQPDFDAGELKAILQRMRKHKFSASTAAKRQAPYQLPPLYKI